MLGTKSYMNGDIGCYGTKSRSDTVVRIFHNWYIWCFCVAMIISRPFANTLHLGKIIDSENLRKKYLL